MAQATPPTRVEFDAASVRRNTSGGTSMQVRTPPGQFTMVNGPVMMLVSIAHTIRDSDRIDAPDWVRTERYDVLARAEGTPDQARLAKMVRALVEERVKRAGRV